ncbi:hypothetical protein TRVA0_093S00122 [Trichomonascus vanleenenianus]|uniref:heat shock factor family protein n=1 Tax=Trichomonascus vanleenenianus TaxID=2268995 RepID=UPI003ECB393A
MSTAVGLKKEEDGATSSTASSATESKPEPTDPAKVYAEDAVKTSPDPKKEDAPSSSKTTEGTSEEKNSTSPANPTNPTDSTNPNGSTNDTKSAPKPGIKVNQAAFIHKLYSMLEDPSISHLISWTPTNDSFVISPGEEFSKVLSQYFKHTNVSSFVRQLNMYGFHKVNDTFHGNATAASSSGGGASGSGDTSQWEFKHGAGSFKRGDVEALRAIKRRASRQSVVHRDNVGLKAVSLSMPSTPPVMEHYAHYPQYQSLYPQHQHQQHQQHQPPLPPQQLQQQPQAQQQQPPQQLPQHQAQKPSQHPHHPPHASQQLPPQPQPSSGTNQDTNQIRISALEQAVWHLQDSNLRAQSRLAAVIDSLRKTQSDVCHVVESLTKVLASDADREMAERRRSSNNSTIHTPTSDELRPDLSSHGPGGGSTPYQQLQTGGDKSVADLERIKTDLYYKMSLLSQLEDYAASTPAPPPHSASYHYQPTTKSERAKSVFYDPLAPAPPPPQPNSPVSDDGGSGTGMRKTSSYSGIRHGSASGTGSNGTTSPASSPRQPDHHYFQQFHSPFYSPNGYHGPPPTAYFGYDHHQPPPPPPPPPPGPPSLPPSLANAPTSAPGSQPLPRDQRPGSYPLMSYHQPAPRGKSYSGPLGKALGFESNHQGFRRHTSGELGYPNTSSTAVVAAMTAASATQSTTQTSNRGSVQSLLNPSPLGSEKDDRGSKRPRIE